MEKKKIKGSARVFKGISFAVLAVYSALIVLILFWTFISSIKHRLDFNLNSLGFPNTKKFGIHFENYLDALKVLQTKRVNGEDVLFPELLWNALFYSGAASFLNLFISMLVAYCCIKFTNSVTKVFYVMAMVCLTMPTVGTMASTLEVMRVLGLYDNMFGMFVMKTSYATTYFLIFCGIFQGVPNDYAEAAKIDGAGNWSIFFRIMLPMVTSTMFACFLMLFIGYWNDYSTPHIYMPSVPVLSYALFEVSTYPRSALATPPVRLASAALVALPTVILFSCFRSRIMENMSLGGLKG